jgi:hypothetical protein
MRLAPPLALAIVASSILASSTVAHAQEPLAPPAPAPTASDVDHRQSMWRLELGYRSSFVADSGFDPFSTNDRLPAFSLVATRTLFARDRFSFAPGLAFESSSSTAKARGDAASLDVQRLAIPLDARVHFGPWGYAFARVAPAMMRSHASITDASAPGALEKTAWVFATDVSAGYAWLAWPWNEPERLRPRLWLQADAGYGFAGSARLALSADDARTDAIDLGSLALRGPFVRAAAAISF